MLPVKKKLKNRRSDNLRIYVLRPCNQMLERILPSYLYYYVLRYAIPVFDKKRRGSKVKARIENGVYVAESPEFKYYFNSPFKIGRYLYSNSSEMIENRLIAKYSDEKVRVEEGDIVIDIGANVGEFTNAISGIASKVIAIEPDPTAYGCLQRNTENKSNVKILQIAIGEKDTQTTFYISSAHSDSSLVKPINHVEQMVEVEVCTLLSIMRLCEIEQIDFLKLEAEGYEPEILEGAIKDGSLSKVHKIAIDGGPERNGEPTADICSSLLTERGFEVSIFGDMVYAIRNKE